MSVCYIINSKPSCHEIVLGMDVGLEWDIHVQLKARRWKSGGEGRMVRVYAVKRGNFYGHISRMRRFMGIKPQPVGDY